MQQMIRPRLDFAFVSSIILAVVAVMSVILYILPLKISLQKTLVVIILAICLTLAIYLLIT